jgi:hypothetical protein
MMFDFGENRELFMLLVIDLLKWKFPIHASDYDLPLCL